MTEATKVKLEKRPGCTRRRLTTVVAAVLAAVVVFYIETLLLGIDLATPTLDDQASREITVFTVINVAVTASLIAWIGMAMLEGMINTKARVTWTVIAVVAFVVSLAGPFAGSGLELSTRFGLAAMHVVVAAILIPLIPDWPPRRDRATATTSA